MPVQMTPSAVKRLRQLLNEHPEESFVRLAIHGEGETLITHRITLEDRAKEGDEELEIDGVKVVMDPQTAQRMSGVTLDYSETGPKPAFSFRHPDAEPEGLADQHRN